MNILAIETSNNICGAAIISDNKIIAEKNIFLPKNSSHKIFNIIKDITKKKLQFDAVAIDIGPGSFTGIRIGISLARAYGQFINVPVVGISSLDCLAFNASGKKNISEKIFPIIDALRGDVYTARYERLNPTSCFVTSKPDLLRRKEQGITKYGVKRKSEYQVVGIEKFLKMIDNKTTIVGSREICQQIPINGICVEAKLSASGVGFLALKKLSDHINDCKKYNYNKVLPLYIRKLFAQEHYKKSA
ncbi:MAG: tRNA (adenosine(37)-N6)-threonylcarbamoyltransferase complex dimerization subunit type 1 TsaB [Elusimicrobiota bacterium]